MTRMIDVDLLIAEFEKVYPLATNEMGGVVNKRIYDIINSIPVVAGSIPYNHASDLISREALKAKMKEADAEAIDYEMLVAMYEKLVNDAPAVQAFTLEDMQNNFDAGVDSVIGKYDKAEGECRTCIHRDPEDKKCDCGALERAGCPFPVSDDYFCKFYEKGGVK